MPKFLEDKLKKEYGEGSDIPYKVMNSMGVMHGNKITPKGIAMEEKHESDQKSASRGRKRPKPSSVLAAHRFLQRGK